MTVKLDNVGIVVEDLDAAIEFFTELGLELEGRAPVEGDWADTSAARITDGLLSYAATGAA